VMSRHLFTGSYNPSFKFKLETVTQQLQLSQVECERTTSELNLKVEEFSKYRRMKHAELSQLQASHDSLKQTHLVAENSLKTLQSNHTALNHKLTQALTRVRDLTGQLAEQEATYASEVSGLRRLVSMMEAREKQAKEIVDNIERDWTEISERAERREAELRIDLDRHRTAREEAEGEIERLQIVLRKVEGGGLPSSNERAQPAQPDSISDLMVGLSPTIAMVSKAQKGGKTFTEVYSEFAQLQQEYDQKCIEYEQMERTLASVLAQIQERVGL
jgi:nucleoprotein TPR